MGIMSKHRHRRNFNPLPRKEGDVSSVRQYRSTQISIHSLVKRETAKQQAILARNGISIHSLVKRETSAASTKIQEEQFQSTPS